MSEQKPLAHIDYKKILYVTDLSESGRQAFPHAVAVARRNDAKLTVFHVVNSHDLQSLASYMSEELWEELTSRNLDDARRILINRRRDEFAISNVEDFCQDCLKEQPDQPLLSYEVKVEIGEPLDKILEEAHSGGYHLLVISKHGNRASVRDAVIGDTTRHVIRRCKIPVLMVPLDE
ncbi:MAG: universal stress protein [Gammaproteobacteria bacterium]|nr:universal stress protein [Gammaproteobacteria bacterium]